MSPERPRFEELDWRQTPMGAISLRRRREPTLGVDVFEAKLDDDFLMSSLFTVAEEELARLGLAAAPDEPLDVLVGGLGLGYTAAAALDDDRVASLVVVEALPDVIGWHERHLLPVSERLTRDARCRLAEADFFATAGSGLPVAEHTGFDVLLVDIDHSPRHVLHPSHQAFYSAAGLDAMRSRLSRDGVFALWSDDPPDPAFEAVLTEVFDRSEVSIVRFPNPLTGGYSTNTVYVAR
jgi:spermidine synthase